MLTEKQKNVKLFLVTCSQVNNFTSFRNCHNLAFLLIFACWHISLHVWKAFFRRKWTQVLHSYSLLYLCQVHIWTLHVPPPWRWLRSPPPSFSSPHRRTWGHPSPAVWTPAQHAGHHGCWSGEDRLCMTPHRQTVEWSPVPLVMAKRRKILYISLFWSHKDLQATYHFISTEKMLSQHNISFSKRGIFFTGGESDFLSYHPCICFQTCQDGSGSHNQGHLVGWCKSHLVHTPLR